MQTLTTPPTAAAETGTRNIIEVGKELYHGVWPVSRSGLRDVAMQLEVLPDETVVAQRILRGFEPGTGHVTGTYSFRDFALGLAYCAGVEMTDEQVDLHEQAVVLEHRREHLDQSYQSMFQAIDQVQVQSKARAELYLKLAGVRV